MSVSWIVVVLSLGSALAFAISTNLKHSSAGQVPNVAGLRMGALARFIAATLSHRLWLAGMVTDAIGLALQVLALHLGALAVVQPLLVSGLLFSLMLRRRRGRRISAAEIRWALVLSGCLIAFLFLAGANHANGGSGPDRLPAVIAAVVGIAVAGACLVLAHRRRPAADAAALIGVAVGVVYAATAALLKGLTDRAVLGPLVALTSWQLYTVIVVGAIGLFFAGQLAFQAGPLTASLPAMATVDPLLSIVVGVMVYDEHIHRGPLSGIGLVALMVLLGISVIELGKVDVIDDLPAAPAAGAGRAGARGAGSKRNAGTRRRTIRNG